MLCSIQEQRSSVAVLLAGTSGTGKSTLAGLLAARLGITTVLSTDNIRHMLRSFAAEDQNPLLWASTYQVNTLTGYGLQSRSCVTNVVVQTQCCVASTYQVRTPSEYGLQSKFCVMLRFAAEGSCPNAQSRSCVMM